MEKIALVSADDIITGFAPKMLVHQQGLLHRAFSIVIFNDNGEMLIQKRASSKYHSGGLWTNACCSHLIEGENFEQYMHNRLQHEMGFDCKLNFLFKFHYKAMFENNLCENEIDHVYTGQWNGTPLPDPSEAEDFCWMGFDEIKEKIAKHPENFTYWFKEIISSLPFREHLICKS